MEYVKVNNSMIPIIQKLIKSNDKAWSGRSTLTLYLEDTYTNISSAFQNNISWSIIEEILDENNEVTGTVEYDCTEYCLAGEIIDYRNGILSIKMGKMYDTELISTIIGDATHISQEFAQNFRESIDTLLNNIDDETAMEVPTLFKSWSVNTTYYGPNDISGHPQSRVRYNNLLYKCLQTHTSQDDWTPDVAVSLWYRIDDPSEEWPEWVQPIGAGTGYPLNAKVSHNNKHWINVGKDDNEYEPGVWGWDEVVEEE